jgi:hypothetical protein
VADPDDIHPLMRIFFLVRMIYLVKQIAILDVKNNLFKRNASLSF